MKVKAYYELYLEKEIEVDDRYLSLLKDDFNEDLMDDLSADVEHCLSIVNDVNGHVSAVYAVGKDNKKELLYEE